jgi:hypothetical protein
MGPRVILRFAKIYCATIYRAMPWCALLCEPPATD